MTDQRLPIQDCLPQIMDAVRGARPVILKAPPGAGKTTGVPPELLKASRLGSQKILLVQPRRIAARAAAHRLSRLASENVGETFGYQVRFDKRLSAKTRVVAMTAGILLRRLAGDPLLDDVGCVLLDEFHERSLELDLALGMLQRIRMTMRPELQIVVMSATLETEPIEQLIADAVSIESQGRSFPVDIRYDDSLQPNTSTRDSIAHSVLNRLPEAVAESDGDILVFLPGVGEIHRAADVADAFARRSGLNVLKLYGDLSPDQQDRVLAPDTQRKLIFATNIAETSVTIPGVSCVIDSGLARVVQYDSSVGIPHLRRQPISKSSADQRAGRAGRTSAGLCYRLWPKALHRSRSDQTPPEILRADLSSLVLTLLSWGERDFDAFPWVTPPKRHAIESAKALLTRLGAVDGGLALTPTGEHLARLPLHPRLARLMIAAEKFGCLDEAAIAAALLSERDPFRPGSQSNVEPRDHLAAPNHVESDLIAKVTRMRRCFDGGSDSGIDRFAAKAIRRVANSLTRYFPDAAPNRMDTSLEEALTRSLLTAFSDRFARRRSAGSAAGLMVGGRGIRLSDSSSVRHAMYFLCLDVGGGGEEALVRSATEIPEEWIESRLIETRDEQFFDDSTQAVVCRRRRYVHDLMIDESPKSCESGEAAARLLAEQARGALDRVMPKDDRGLQSLIARWRFLDEFAEDSTLPMSADEACQTVLEELCQTRTSFKELTRAPWRDHLCAQLSYEQQQWMNRMAPDAIEVPSGNQIRIDYPTGKPPILAVRIQEIFGWKSVPKLAGGKVPVQLHLLGPNRRPQQITEDLQSFWASTYHEIRKDLRRRYAKHHWPEDPQNAIATRNGLQPRK